MKFCIKLLTLTALAVGLGSTNLFCMETQDAQVGQKRTRGGDPVLQNLTVAQIQALQEEPSRLERIAQRNSADTQSRAVVPHTKRTRDGEVVQPQQLTEYLNGLLRVGWNPLEIIASFLQITDFNSLNQEEKIKSL